MFQGLINRGDYIFCGDKGWVCLPDVQLRVYGSQVAGWSHENAVGTHRKQGTCALGVIRDDDGQLSAPSLHRSDHTNCDLRIAARSIK